MGPLRRSANPCRTTFVNLNAIEQTQEWRQPRVDGVSSTRRRADAVTGARNLISTQVPPSGFQGQCLLLRTRQTRGLDACVAIVEKTLKSKANRPAMLAWLARALALAKPLSEIKIQRDRAFHPRRCASPAFLLNTVSLILRLAAPLWTKGLASKVCTFTWVCKAWSPKYAFLHESVRLGFKSIHFYIYLTYF